MCVGESVVLAKNSPVKRVELYVGWRREWVTPDHPFHNTGGVVSAAQQSIGFASRVLGLAKDVRAPPVPTTTAARGGADDAPSRPLRTLRALSDLPTQRLTSDVAPVLAWREGSLPYRCEARNDRGDTVASAAAPDTHDAWCAFDRNAGGTVQLLVIDADSAQQSWDVGPARWTDVPKPAWLASDARGLAPGDRIAWALWLWKSAGPEWRIQALAMLNQLAPTTWAAGYARDCILAEMPNLTPDERAHQ